MTVVLRLVSAEAAAAVLAGELPPDVRVAEGFPTEFSAGIAEQAARASPLGPFYVHRTGDDVVVGEIGGAETAPGTVEIGYATAESCQGRGYATEAVILIVEMARSVGGVADEHEGVVLRVTRWELRL